MIEELVEQLGNSDSGWSKNDVKEMLDALDEYVVKTVAEGYRVKVAGVVIGPAVRAAQKKRMGRNPQTGEEIPIPAKPASAVIRAKIVKPLKDAKLPAVKKLQTMM